MDRPSLLSGNCGCACDSNSRNPGKGNRRIHRHQQPSSFNNVAVALALLFSILIGISSASTQPSFREDGVVVASKKISEVGTEKAAAAPPPPDHSRTLKDKDDGGAAVEGPSSKTLFFGEDTNGVPIVVGTWFRYGSYTLAFAMFGQAFLVSCVAAAIYYVVFVVTEPSQQIRSMKGGGGEGGSSWNVGKVLRALQIAYDTYESFDPYSPDCQLKTLCEIQESPHFQGTVLRRVTHYLVHTDLVETKLENAKQLRAADKIGNDPRERCEEKFDGCRFSLNKLYESYTTVMS